MRLFLSCRKSRSHPGHPTTFPSLSQKGASLVEFALVLPLLILITFGIIEFGIVMYNQQVITNAAREGARRGIVQVTVGNRILPAEIRQTVLTAARNDLISFTGDTLENENIAVTPEAGCTAYPQNLTVRVTYPVTFPVLRSFGIGGFDLTAESTMTCE